MRSLIGGRHGLSAGMIGLSLLAGAALADKEPSTVVNANEEAHAHHASSSSSDVRSPRSIRRRYRRRCRHRIS